jgi:hypothetical protein
MSTYSEISKRIGFEGKASIPTLQHAIELLRKVHDDKSEEAFEEVFKIHRFAESPDNDSDIDTMNVIMDAFTVGKKIFS